jgi:hypothetical protein
MKKTSYFDTGVRPELVSNPPFNYEYHKQKGNVIRGTLLIPFECEDVPEGAIFEYAGHEGLSSSPDIKAFPIIGGNIQSKFAYFKLPNEN